MDFDLDSGRASQPLASGGYYGAYDTLLQCFADEVRADAVCLIVREGFGGPTRVVSSLDSGGRGEPHRWLDGEFLSRLLDSDGPILEPEDGMVFEPAIRLVENEGSIEHALGAVVPSPGGVEAILCAGFTGPPGPGPAQLLWAAGSFATVAALCLTDTGGFTDALSWSRFDPLTGCLTYAGLVDSLAREIDRSARQHHRLSCCFIDLGGFKQVNEVVGYPAGNRVLFGIGARLRDSVRTYDVVGRSRGDEFVIILPETSGRSAREMAERLRRQLRTEALGATKAPVEVSIGTAQWVAGMSAEDLLETAHRSLRVAKKDGGSSVVSVSSPDQAVESIHGIFESVTQLMGRDDRPQRSRDGQS
jgi:diguanylate cyclase (GGDEF)-like protein